MTLLRVKSDALLSISVFSILFAATYRDDADLVSMGATGDFSDVAQSPFVGMLKAVAIYAFAIPILAVALGLIKKPQIGRVIGPLTSILSFLVVLLMLRLLPGAPDVSGKMLSTIGVLSLIVILAMCTAGAKRAKEANVVAIAIYKGVFAFAMMHSMVNATLSLTGFGAHKSRFLGTSIHPNFIGVQMACCAVLMLGGLRGGFGRGLLALLGVTAALIALVAAGSRTGLVVFGTGFIVFWGVRGLKLWQAVLLALLTLALSFGVIVSGSSRFDVSMDQYDRGGADTRAEAWTTMWQAVNDSPLIGGGVYPQASESSYLRGWAAIGILYVLSYIAFLLAAVRAALLLPRRSDGSVQTIAFIGVIFALLSGGFFEGYLLDTLSFPIIVLISATISVDSLRLTTRKSRSRSRSRSRVRTEAGNGLRFPAEAEIITRRGAQL